MPDEYIFQNGPSFLDGIGVGPVTEAGHPVGWTVDARDEAGRPTSIAGLTPAPSPKGPSG